MDPIKEAFLKAKQDIQDLKQAIDSLRIEIEELKSAQSPQNPTSFLKEQTNTSENPTQKLTELDKTEIYSPLSSNTLGSTGNKGVPTNKQTNQQTDTQALSGLLASFDAVKEELKVQFKSLTKQEMEVFSAIYMLEEQKKQVDYPSLAAQLGLSEISIRDYILKMTRKGIPILKSRLNNNRILLSIDPSLKKIASLSSILRLREH